MRKEADAFFADFEGEQRSTEPPGGDFYGPLKVWREASEGCDHGGDPVGLCECHAAAGGDVAFIRSHDVFLLISKGSEGRRVDLRLDLGKGVQLHPAGCSYQGAGLAEAPFKSPKCYLHPGA